MWFLGFFLNRTARKLPFEHMWKVKLQGRDQPAHPRRLIRTLSGRQFEVRFTLKLFMGQHTNFGYLSRICAIRNKSRLLFSSAEMFKKPL